MDQATARQMTLEEMIDRCGELAAEKSAIEREMQGYRKAIADAAAFAAGSRTARLAGGRYTAKVELKEEVRYDKDSLMKAMDAMGREDFRRLFKWEFAPAVRKPELDAYIRHGAHGPLVEAARVVRMMSPAVSFVLNEEV
jgi:hypothetical protein